MPKQSPTNNTDFSLILASSIHDMKNSLGMLLHSLEDLCDQLPPENNNGQGIGTIRYEAERVNNDLIQLLGVYRLQQNKLSAHLDEHYLDDIFSEQHAQYDEILRAKGVTLEQDNDHNLAWFFDRELVCGILNNAINNASRYTNNKVLLATRKVTLSEHEFLEISVNDDGEGYPPAILDITPSDIQNNLNFKTGSTSLGLYFASQVAALHELNDQHGRIELSNGGALGGGLFRLYLP